MSTVIRKLYILPDASEWVGEISKTESSDIPEVMLNEVFYDGDLSDVVYSQQQSESDILDLLSSKYFSTAQYVRPVLRDEYLDFPTKSELLEKLLNSVQAMRNFRDDFSDNSELPYPDTYSRLMNLGDSSVLPGFIPYRDTELVIRKNDYDSVDSALQAAIGVLSSYSKSNNNQLNKLQASIIPISQARSQENNTMYPGDLFKLLVKGGSGMISKVLSGVSRFSNSNDIYKVTAVTPTTAEQSISDGKASITININVTLPANVTNSSTGEEEEV